MVKKLIFVFIAFCLIVATKIVDKLRLRKLNWLNDSFWEMSTLKNEMKGKVVKSVQR